MLDYKWGSYRFDIREGEFNLQEVHERFEKYRTDPSVVEFRQRQKKVVEHNLAVKKTYTGNGQLNKKPRKSEKLKESRLRWRESLRSLLIAQSTLMY